jgi:hypothetical protein
MALLVLAGASAHAQPADAQPVKPAELTTFKKNGGWCWYQDERVIVHDRQMLLGTVAGTTRAGHAAGDVDVTTYDIEDETRTTVTMHERLDQDDHATPSLVRLPSGKYLAAYSTHGHDAIFRYRTTRRPADAEAWSDEQRINLKKRGKVERVVTYTNLHYLAEANDGDGRLYNFSRIQGFDPNWMYSNDGGASWTWAGQVLDWPGRPYVKYASDGEDTIHLSTTDAHPRGANNSIYYGYIRDGTLHDARGIAVQDLDDGPLDEKHLTEVFEGDPHNVAWTTDLHLDAEGHPVIGFSVQKDGATFKNNRDAGPGWDHRYYYAHYDGNDWQVNEMAYAGSGLYPREADYTGLLAIDPNMTNVVYVSSDVHPQTGLPNVSEADDERHYEIFKGVTQDGGASWTWTPVTKNSDVDNLRPVVPKWDDRRAVLWQRGVFRTFQDYDMNIVGFVTERGPEAEALSRR